ncbi:MAG: hypothetical protein PHO27_12005 [Sulfuricurvum sp.]|jgi:hypothetical protein|nr:hypothetical protein [Sulfuricurvum sp.]
MKALLIGYGEVGKGIHEAWGKYHDIKVYDPGKAFNRFERDVDICLIAIPYNDKFVSEIQKYKKWINIVPLVIFSSVPVGTSRKLDAIHSPIEGDHCTMGESISKHYRYVGGYAVANGWTKDTEIVCDFFKEAKCDVVLLPCPEHTEFLKLRSTLVYGINIELARYSNEVAMAIGLNYAMVKEYDWFYNQLVKATGRPGKQRYVLDAPYGRIGGHCILPNAEILNGQYPHPFIQTLLETNKKKEA